VLKFEQWESDQRWDTRVDLNNADVPTSRYVTSEAVLIPTDSS
jgi:hypothetical protein